MNSSPAQGRGTLVLYAATILTSAALMFLVQPMFGRFALPLLGGSPAVWNTMMVFFQATLLAGYGYAHASARLLPMRVQVLVHAGLIVAALFALPPLVPAGLAPPTEASPTPWLLGLLLRTIGLPFFVLSATAPLVQHWFSRTGHRDAADPYFLYAASNIGSFSALLAYPTLIEPSLRLGSQAWAWSAGFVVLGLGLIASGVVAARGNTLGGERPGAARTSSGRERSIWILLSFLPSSLLLGVTTHITSDLVSAPLLWILPLAIYLLSFVLVFARRPPLSQGGMSRVLPWLLVPTLFLTLFPIGLGAYAVALHLVTFFVVAMVAHGELARRRPEAGRLTEFYFWVSLGGVFGGVFNALVAPLVFDTVLEYPLMLTAAALCRPPRPGDDPRPRLGDFAWPFALALYLGALLLARPWLAALPTPVTVLLFVLPPPLAYVGLSARPLRFALGLAAMHLLVGMSPSEYVASERSFFGVNRVLVDDSLGITLLVHGTTVHGVERTDREAREPMLHYARSGPFGQMFSALASRGPMKVAVAGLGVGGLACYTRPGDAWTYYEIDPVVERLARDARYFHVFNDCGRDMRVVLGDARLSLAREADGSLDVIIVDVYSSDAIPAHMLTREAVALYLQKLAPGGVVFFHISNRHLDLAPVIAGLAGHLGLVARFNHFVASPEQRATKAAATSIAAVMARSEADLGALATDTRWRASHGEAEPQVWTDDFSNIVGVIRWGGVLGR